MPPAPIVNLLKNATLHGVPGLREYALAHSYRTTPELDGLFEATQAHHMRGYASPPDSIPIVQFLLKTLRAKKVVEVGVFSGYLTLALALALPEDGKVVALELKEEYPAIGKPFWEKAGVASRIDLRLGPAQASLDKLLEAGDEEGTYDLVFIDADKTGYDGYYEAALRLLRRGGIVAIDNVFWDGTVVKPPEEASDSTKAIQALNKKVYADERVDICMLSNADGITLALKR